MNDLLKSRDGWKAEAEHFRQKYFEILHERNSLRDTIDGNVWYWQEDEENYLESLTCNIVISPSALRKIIK